MIKCHIFRKWITWQADANGELSGWARSHAQSCPACREFYGAMRNAVKELSASAESERREPSAYLRGKIMAAVRAEENVVTRPATGRMSWALAAGAAGVVIVAGIVSSHRPAAPTQQAAVAPVAEELTLNLPTAAQMNNWTKALDRPLENELQLVLGDAQAAMNSLKQNFLPGSDKPASPGQN